MRPFVEAMVKEGSAALKPPCNTDDFINPTVPYCLKGSPWITEMAVTLLVGKMQNALISVINDDNFHAAATVYPYHHPEMDGTCDLNTTVPCQIKHFSVTENAYNMLNELDTGKQAIAAYEMRVKMKSSQIMHQAAGETDASFLALDQQKDECARINQAAWDWAYSVASDAAKANYNKYGEKVAMTLDKIQENGGLWIPQPLKETENTD